MKKTAGLAYQVLVGPDAENDIGLRQPALT